MLHRNMVDLPYNIYTLAIWCVCNVRMIASTITAVYGNQPYWNHSNIRQIYWMQYYQPSSKWKLYPLGHPYLVRDKLINPLRAKYFIGNRTYICISCQLFYIDMPQVFGILPRERPRLAYFTYPMSELLMTWRRKEPGHQKPCYWPN